jgi:hypothetical protein
VGPSSVLTPLDATLLLERITALLAPSSSLEGNQKLLVFKLLFKLVSAGALNEAVMFGQWSDSVKKDADGSKSSPVHSDRFLVAFGEFSKVIKGFSFFFSFSQAYLRIKQWRDDIIELYCQRNR